MTSQTAPLPQHLREHAHANEVRRERAKLKRRIAGGETPVAAVIRRCPPEAASMEVVELLMAQHRWGEYRAVQILNRAGTPVNKRMRDLTARQREALIAALDGSTVPDPFVAAARHAAAERERAAVPAYRGFTG